MLYWRGGGDTARFVRNLAKSKNGHGQNGQSGQKIGQNGHRTDITYCFYYIITFFKTFLVWFAVCDKYYF